MTPDDGKHAYAGLSCAAHCLDACQAWCAGSEVCLGGCADACVPACMSEGLREAAGGGGLNGVEAVVQAAEAEAAAAAEAEARSRRDGEAEAALLSESI